jgi:hypothetical protein
VPLLDQATAEQCGHLRVVFDDEHAHRTSDSARTDESQMREAPP